LNFCGKSSHLRAGSSWVLLADQQRREKFFTLIKKNFDPSDENASLEDIDAKLSDRAEWLWELPHRIASSK